MQIQPPSDPSASNYDPLTGYANGATGARELQARGLPLSIYQAAMNLVKTGKSPTFESALATVAVENQTPLDRVARVFSELFTTEEKLLAEEAEAAARLKEVTGQLARVRSEAVGIVNTRDRLRLQVAALRDELIVLRGKRTLIAARRAKGFAEIQRHLRKLIVIPWFPLADCSATVAGFDLVIAEVDSQIAQKVTALALAETESEEFEKKHVAALSLVDRRSGGPQNEAAA